MHIKEGKALYHFIHMEEQIIRLLKSEEDQGETSEKEKNNLYSSGLEREFYMALLKSINH